MRTHIDVHLRGVARVATVARTTEGRLAVEIDEGPADCPVAVHGTADEIEELAMALLEGVRRAMALPRRSTPLPPAERVSHREDGATAVAPVTWPPLEVAVSAGGDA